MTTNNGSDRELGLAFAFNKWLRVENGRSTLFDIFRAGWIAGQKKMTNERFEKILHVIHEASQVTSGSGDDD